MYLGTQRSNRFTRLRRALPDIIRWGCGRRSRFLVHGKSMLPTLFEGVSVFCATQRPPKPHEIIVLIHPHRHNYIMIKRCIKLSNKGIWVEGDNKKYSTDSRHFGWIEKELYIGTVTSFL